MIYLLPVSHKVVVMRTATTLSPGMTELKNFHKTFLPTFSTRKETHTATSPIQMRWR